MVNSIFQLIGSTIAGGGNFISIGIGEHHFDMRALLKGRDLNIDMQAIAIGIRLGGQRCDLVSSGVIRVRLSSGKKKSIRLIITKRKLPAFMRKRAIGLQNYYVSRHCDA